MGRSRGYGLGRWHFRLTRPSTVVRRCSSIIGRRRFGLDGRRRFSPILG
ncbi:MAG: hypothetical protein V1894_03565 [Chloroflexota bacterium]